MRAISPITALVSFASLILSACGAESPSVQELNSQLSTENGGVTEPIGMGGAGGTAPIMSTGSAPPAGGETPAPPPMAGTVSAGTPPVTGPEEMGGAAPEEPDVAGPEETNMGGTSPDEPEMGPEETNMGGAPPEMGTAGAGPDEPNTAGMPPEIPEEPAGPYAPRTGPFKMLVYSKTAAFRHTDAINAGRMMLQTMATEQGFEVNFTETDEEITVEGLSQYEILFFLNSTGDIFQAPQEAAFEEWMTEHDGAFAGVHAATDTEQGWPFYKEVTGQYYDGHDPCCSEAEIEWDAAATNFIAVKGLPSPWRRSEEWYKFNSANEWTAKAGFMVLGRVTNGSGQRPASYIREWGNFRSFYTSLGHEGPTFNDANVKKHVAAGIMWAVRREAELK